MLGSRTCTNSLCLVARCESGLTTIASNSILCGFRFAVSAAKALTQTYVSYTFLVLSGFDVGCFGCFQFVSNLFILSAESLT